MHLITLTAPVELGKTLGVLQAGQFLLGDLNAFEIAQIAARGTAHVTDRGWAPWFNPQGEPVIMRSGAIGDLVMLTPALAAWKFKTGNKVRLCCFPHHFPIFEGSGLVDELLPYPLPFERMTDISDVICLENTMELDHDHHITDVFAKALGVPTPLASYHPIYSVNAEEESIAKEFMFKGRPTLACQLLPSIANRNWTPQAWSQVIFTLEQKGWGILIMGAPGQVPPLNEKSQTPFIRNLTQEKLTLRQSVAILGQCDAFVGIDSALLHFANALDVPAVGLFGPFSWKVRTSQAELTTAIQGKAPCSPCNWHMHGGSHFPPNKPCSNGGGCIAMADISPERVITKVMLLKPAHIYL